jgi:ABC-2 type transport system ATP-binding protein
MPISDDPYIVVDDLSISFGDTSALGGVSLRVGRGNVFGLVGSDGAGKSTLLRAVATMIRPTRGSITIKGLDVSRQRWKVKPLIGYMPQRFGLYQDLTVEENMDFFLDIFGIMGRERAKRKEKYLGFSNLLPYLDRPAGALSGGMKQKLGLACVLVHEPEALILDEPTNGVDPVSRQEFWDILLQMRGAGMTIMVSTAYLDEGQRCDRVGLMHKSRLIAEDSPEKISAGYPNLEEAMIGLLMKEDIGLAHDTFKR